MIALTIDVTTLDITGWRKGIPDPLTRKVGTIQDVGIIFEKDGQPYELAPGNSGDVIARAKRGNGLLAASVGWTTATWGDRTIYVTSLSLNTDEITTASASNTKRVPAKLEVSFTEPDTDERSATINFLIVPREREGGEGPPTPVDPSYPSAATLNQLIVDVGTKQPLDADLTAIAALSTTTYGRAFLTLANQAALLALLPSYQPLDSDLTAIATLTTTSFGRALLTLANSSALRTAADLAVGSAVQFGSVTTGALVASSVTSSGSVAAAGDLSFSGAINGVTAAELAFVAGVTSAIQSQIDGRQPLDSDLTAIAALSTTTFGRALLTMADAAALRVVAGLSSTDTPTFAGVTNASNAATGKVGEYLSSIITGGFAVSLTTGVDGVMTSLSLGAGDWEISGHLILKAGSGTTVSRVQAGVNVVSAILPGYPPVSAVNPAVDSTTDIAFVISPLRYSQNAGCTASFVVLADFSVSTLGAYGKLQARRIR